MVTFLSGGTGTPKVLWGAGDVFPREETHVVVNTGDDVDLGGLHVSPDIDTVIFERAGVLDRETWWGIAEDPTVTTDRVRELTDEIGGTTDPRYLSPTEQTAGRPLSAWRRFAGVPAFMTIGDRDRAHHMLRSHLLDAGYTLTEATRTLCRAYDVDVNVLPMSDDPVSTIVQTPTGEMHFQEYWVAHRGDPTVTGIEFRGSEEARLTASVSRAVEEPIVIGPANPVTSLGPMLAIPGMRERLEESPVVAVSPFINDQVFSGPAAALMRGTGWEASTAGVAARLPMVDGFVIDTADTTSIDRVTVKTDTRIETRDDARRVAEACATALAEVA